MHKIQETINLLRDSESFYTLIVGMDSTYSYVSPSYEKNFDFTGSSLAGKPFYITLHPDDVALCEQTGNSSFTNPDKLHEVVLRKNNGKGGYIHTHWEFKAMFNEENIPVGIFCIGYNITAHVETQQLVETKSGKLKAIGFMQSHDLRKPLANIMGLLHTFDKSSSAAELIHLKFLLLRSAEELDTIVKKISDESI